MNYFRNIYIPIVLIVLTCLLHVTDIEAITPPDKLTPNKEKTSFGHLFGLNEISLGNNSGLTDLCIIIDSLNNEGKLRAISVNGYSSPDGPEPLNKSLSLQRAKSISDYLSAHTNLNDDYITVSGNGEDWHTVREYVEKDLPAIISSNISSVIDSESNLDIREKRLRSLNGGDVWRRLTNEIFPLARRCVIHIETEENIIDISMGAAPSVNKIEIAEKADTIAPKEEATVETSAITSVTDSLPKVTLIPEQTISEEISITDVSEIQDTYHSFHIKSNLPAWLMLWTNIAFEYDLSQQWSVTLPIYYSGFNYFTGRVKFRTFAVIPELRFWLNSTSKGFFFNVHAGMAYYDYAKGGDFRYQDHNKTTPALGGGVGLGYRFPLGRDSGWSMEAAVGAGIYHLDYDIFHNYHNGLITDRRKRTFYGIDQAALSLIYSFGKKKKGGGI